MLALGRRKIKDKEINGIRLDDWEVDLFLCDDGRLGMTIYKGQLGRGAEDVRPWEDVFVVESDGHLEVSVS
jgi:hypothetical protein